MKSSYQESMPCPYNKQNQLPPCLSIPNKKWWYLKNFLQKKYSGLDYLSIIPQLGCINLKDGTITINETKCIKCLFCVANCPKQMINIFKGFALDPSCWSSDIARDDDISNRFFKGNLVTTPLLGWILSTVPYKTLEEFTKVNETKNIAVWWASLIKYLSKDIDSQLWLEIKMVISTRDRGWRLDICLYSWDNFLLAVETKVWFKKMMQEDRYTGQMIAYKEEIKNILSEFPQLNISNFEILLIGDKETDLLFESHPMCTSKVWNQSKIFYKNLVDHKLFFMSSTALWGLAIKKLFTNNEDYSIENVLQKIMSHHNVYWLISSWVILRENNQFIIKDLDYFL